MSDAFYFCDSHPAVVLAYTLLKPVDTASSQELYKVKFNAVSRKLELSIGFETYSAIEPACLTYNPTSREALIWPSKRR